MPRDYADIIAIKPGKLGGKPCIRPLLQTEAIRTRATPGRCYVRNDNLDFCLLADART